MTQLPFLFDANLLCLDLVNTRPVLDGRLTDLLPDFAALVAWLERAGVLDAAEAREIGGRWRGTPEADEALQLALDLRDGILDAVDQILAGKPVRDPSVDTINRALAAGASVGEVVRDGRGFRRTTRRIVGDPASPVAAVAESAATLLSELDWSRLGHCADPACVLYFYDTSKNRARRWCSMERCGNRAKVHAFRRGRGGKA